MPRSPVESRRTGRGEFNAPETGHGVLGWGLFMDGGERVEVMPSVKSNTRQFADDAAPVPQVMSGLDCDQEMKGDPSGSRGHEPQLQRAREVAERFFPGVCAARGECSLLAG